MMTDVLTVNNKSTTNEKVIYTDKQIYVQSEKTELLDECAARLILRWICSMCAVNVHGK